MKIIGIVHRDGDVYLLDGDGNYRSQRTGEISRRSATNPAYRPRKFEIELPKWSDLEDEPRNGDVVRTDVGNLWVYEGDRWQFYRHDSSCNIPGLNPGGKVIARAVVDGDDD